MIVIVGRVVSTAQERRGTNNQNYTEPTVLRECCCNPKTRTHTNCLPVHTLAHKPSVCMTPPLHFEWSFSLSRTYCNGLGSRMVATLAVLIKKVALAKTSNLTGDR